MKTGVKILLAVVVVGLIIFFSPWISSWERRVPECDEYCQSAGNLSPDCMVTYGGCFDMCAGFSGMERCLKKNRCTQSCQKTCFGWNLGTCTGFSAVLQDKLEYIGR